MHDLCLYFLYYVVSPLWQVLQRVLVLHLIDPSHLEFLNGVHVDLLLAISSLLWNNVSALGILGLRTRVLDFHKLQLESAALLIFFITQSHLMVVSANFLALVSIHLDFGTWWVMTWGGTVISCCEFSVTCILLVVKYILVKNLNLVVFECLLWGLDRHWGLLSLLLCLYLSDTLGCNSLWIVLLYHLYLARRRLESLWMIDFHDVWVKSVLLLYFGFVSLVLEFDELLSGAELFLLPGSWLWRTQTVGCFGWLSSVRTLWRLLTVRGMLGVRSHHLDWIFPWVGLRLASVVLACLDLFLNFKLSICKVGKYLMRDFSLRNQLHACVSHQLWAIHGIIILPLICLNLGLSVLVLDVQHLLDDVWGLLLNEALPILLRICWSFAVQVNSYFNLRKHRGFFWFKRWVACLLQ